MENRIANRIEADLETQNRRIGDAHPIGEILEELLAQYQARFPGIHIARIETSANAL